MDNNIWTDESIAGANLLAKRYMKTGTTLLCILTPLIVFTILTKSKPHPTRRYYHQPLYITNAIPLVWNLSPDIMHILVHTGLKFGRFAVVPRILPNTCELAKVVEGKGYVWPCARDEMVETWKASGVAAVSVLWRNMLYGMVVRAMIYTMILPAAEWLIIRFAPKPKEVECGKEDCACRRLMHGEEEEKLGGEKVCVEEVAEA